MVQSDTRTLLSAIDAARPEIAKAAQAVYDSWAQDAGGMDEELGSGGICDEVAEAIASVFSMKGYDTTSGGQDGDDHAYTIVYDQNKAYAVDIPCQVYEIGGGYSWKKRPGVMIQASDVAVWEVERKDLDFEPQTDDPIYKVPSWPEVKGIFIGGCVERGVGSSFRAKAHAHNANKEPYIKYFGWICVRSIKRIGETSGQVVTKPSRLLWHEYAHILTPNHGHDDTWRAKMRELHQPMESQYDKKTRS